MAVCLIGLIAALALLLGACGNRREAEARAAFIALLQGPQRGRRSGGPVALPSLSGKSGRAGTGDYAQEAYGIMSDYQAESCARPRSRCAGCWPPRRCARSAISSRAAALTLARKTLQANVAAVREARARADKAVPRWNCRPICAHMTACDESLTAPANELLAAADTLDAVARDALAIADFRGGERAGIELAGGQARVATPSLQQALNLRLQGLNAQSDDLERAREPNPSGGGSEPDGSGGDALGQGGVDACDGGVVSAPAVGPRRRPRRFGASASGPNSDRTVGGRCDTGFVQCVSRGASRNRDRP